MNKSVKFLLLFLAIFSSDSWMDTAEVAHCRQIFEIRNQPIIYPGSIAELQRLVRKASQEGTKVTVMGAGKSQGGQTVSSDENSYRISLEHLNKLVSLDVVNKEVTIEAGATWAQLINYINPHGLAVKAMQSYSTFSIGGSLGVNVHGQDIIENPLIRTVRSFKILLADGTIHYVSRVENAELFGLAIGGYGLLGIIIEVTLELTDDELLDQRAVSVSAQDGIEYFYSQIDTNPNIRFMSARLQLTEKEMFKNALFITYEKSKKTNPALHKLEKPGWISWRKWFIALLGRSSLRYELEKKFHQMTYTISRNNFMNVDNNFDLPQEDANKKYILQEYFIPPAQHKDSANVMQFREHLLLLIKEYDIKIYNISARLVRQDTESKLSFAHTDSCALVFFIEVPKNDEEYNKTVAWTRSLIDKTLALNGTFYLPYQLIATQEQFEKAYPAWKEFVQLKKKYDPRNMFTNQLYEKYAS